MWRQCAAAKGWDAVLAPKSAAVLASGATDKERLDGPMVLSFVPADFDEAINALPTKIQTIGYGVSASGPGQLWLDLLGQTGIDRLVPIGRMHHFGPVWDGQTFWRQSFDEVEVV